MSWWHRVDLLQVWRTDLNCACKVWASSFREEIVPKQFNSKEDVNSYTSISDFLEYKHDLSAMWGLLPSLFSVRPLWERQQLCQRIKLFNPARPNVTSAPRQDEDEKPTPTDTAAGSTVSQGLVLLLDGKEVGNTDRLESNVSDVCVQCIYYFIYLVTPTWLKMLEYNTKNLCERCEPHWCHVWKYVRKLIY